MKYKVGDTITFVNFNGKLIDEKKIVKYRGEFKDIDSMSVSQRLNYRIHSLKRKTAYKWKRHLVNNRQNNSAMGLGLTAVGLFGLCNTDMIGGYIYAGLVLAYGCTLIRARRKNGALSAFINKLKEDDKSI